ncbi:MAG TPA: protein kinase [Polyangiaceae bacterium]|nr:protein kinase [Polyangiaceae bacterium]
MVAGRYEVLARVGGGGMGAVYRVRDRELGETVALKVLRNRNVPDARVREAWRQEVRLARKVVHPNVCRVFDIGETDDLLFLTMELVEGRSLRALLVAERPSPRASLDLLIQTASGLAAVHGRGIVHRDVKPENIIVRHDGRAVLVDFGLAATEDALERSSGGTPGYVAPEQLRGERVDARADVFSMGVLAFELLTGDRPPAPSGGGAPAPRPSAALWGWPAEARERLEAIIDRALSRDKEARFLGADELLEALEGVRRLLELATSVPPHAAPAKGPKGLAGYAPLGALAAAALAAASWWYASGGPDRSARSAGGRTTAAAARLALPPETWQTPPLIKVLPFEAPQGGPKLRELAAAATDATTSAVRARSDVRLCDASCDGNDAAVSIVRGSVAPVGDRVRVEVQLLDGRGTDHPEPFELVEGGDSPGLFPALRRGVTGELRLFARARQRRLRDAQLSASEAAKKALAAYRALVGARLLGGQIPEAEPLLDTAVGADPGYVPALLERAYLRMMKVATTGDNRWLEGAQGDVERALQARPGDPEAAVMKCSVLRYAAIRDRRSPYARIEAAMSACTEARAIAPDDVNPLRYMAKLYDYTCQDQLALATLQAALDLDGSHTGELADHLIELALQNDQLPLADRFSAQLVAFQENEQAEGPRSLSRKAGVEPTKGAYFKRAAVLLRQERWEEARAALEKELALASPGFADARMEAAALHALVLLEGKGYGKVAPKSRGRLEQLEKSFPPEAAFSVSFTYGLVDPNAALKWLDPPPAEPSCDLAIHRAALLRAAGQVERARAEVRACRPEGEREKRCVDLMAR